jgi:antitoxin component YwqK of YwqJK toxin-antitoxin module
MKNYIFLLINFSLMILFNSCKSDIKEQKNSIVVDMNNENPGYLFINKEVIYYKGDLFTGTLILRYNNDTIQIRMEVKEGLRNGKILEYNSNGELKSVSNWIEGEEIEERKYFKDKNPPSKVAPIDTSSPTN